MFSPRIQIAVSETPANSAARTPYHSDNESSEAEEEFQSSDEEEAQLEEEEQVQNNSVSTTSLMNIQEHQSMEFPINGECTSLSLSPSGNFLWAGFSDGTLRVFDLTGNFGLEKDAAVASRQKSSLLVASKWCQTYGAVACQIHARGVHTDLITQVGVCDDYVFCGVSRGAMELYAVDFSALDARVHGRGTKKENILDYLHVHEKADAKLKGFGACTKLKHTARPTYLLLTGKGIKNIHIWSFQPPLTSREDEEPIWTQLYDTQTNGNTINLLGFYRAPAQNKLLGVSQSDSQKLRLWDLSAEEQGKGDEESKDRAKRPPYVDVANSQAALGLAAGGFCVCGGPTMYNQLSIVSLDQPKNAYNHTELALPAGDDDVAAAADGARRSSSRRQRRGDLKQVANVASPPEGDINAGHVLLELDDGTIVQYTMANTMASDSKLQILQPPTIPALPDDYWKRTICLASSRHHMGALIVAMSLYNPNTQKGKLVLRKLAGTEQEVASLELATSSKPLLQTPPPRDSSLSQPKIPVNAANSTSPETDVAAIKTLCMAPPVTKKSKSSKSDGERIKAKKEKKKKRKEERMMEEEAFKRRSSNSELKAESKNEKLEESKRSLNLETDTLKKPKDKTKRKKQASPEMVTPARESSKNALPDERIFVKKVKVIPLSGEKKAKKTVSAGSSPSNSVSISSPSAESDQSKKGDDFETPAKKDSNSSTTTVSNADTKVASQTQQVSPDSSVVPTTKPVKTTGDMDRFVVSQKQLKMVQLQNKERSKSKQSKLTKEQKEKQQSLKVASVPRKSRPNGTVAEEMEEKPVDETAADETEMMLDEANEKDEELSPVEAAVAPTIKLPSKKKRQRPPPPASSTDATEHKKRKVTLHEMELKSPPRRKKFSAEDPPPSREDVHATRVKAEFKRIQDLIAHLPKFVPLLLRQEAPLAAPKSIMEAQARERSKLESNHRAAHEMIQRRMLRSAESIIRNAVDYHLSVEEARDELKGTVKSYQEVVHETLQRHKLEAETLVAQQMRARCGLEVPIVEVRFPFQQTFREIEEARRAIEAPRRLPGRPRTG